MGLIQPYNLEFIVRIGKAVQLKKKGICMKGRRVVIVGAGPGGLAAAIQLAYAGVSVTVLEALDRVGGRCSNIQEEGFRFDVGPTFFLYPRVLKEIFESVGRNLMLEVPMKKLDPQYRVSFGEGGSLDCTPNVAEMERRISALCPADGPAFRRYMDENRVKLARFRPVLEASFNSVFDLLRPSMFGAVPYLKPWKSLSQELNHYFSDPRLAIAMSFQSKYLGMSPFQCPSLFSILSFLEYEYGVFHPIGGCSRVSERMGEIAQEMGVDIRLNEPVKSMEFSGRRATAVITDKKKYEADTIVLNADFAAAMEKFIPNDLRKRWTNEKLVKKRYSCSTFMLYLGIDGELDVPHHNIHIAKDYERNLRQIEQEGVLPDEPSFYVQNPCVTDPDLAPRGKSALYILVPVPNLMQGKVTWDDATKQKYRALTFKRLEEIGIRDLEKRICFEKMITPAEWKSNYNTYQGTTFNLAHNLKQMLHLRPHNRFEDVDGVYLVGGGTHPGSGLPVIYESARITCKQLLQEFGLSPQFIQSSQTKPISSLAMST